MALTIYQLTCGHTVKYKIPPRTGDTVYCYACDGFREVDSQRWTVRCTECHYAANYPGAPFTAETRASVHAIKRGHRVNVLLNDRVHRGFGPEAPGQLALMDLAPYSYKRT
jgi:hypothetical protein